MVSRGKALNESLDIFIPFNNHRDVAAIRAVCNRIITMGDRQLKWYRTKLDQDSYQRRLKDESKTYETTKVPPSQIRKVSKGATGYNQARLIFISFFAAILCVFDRIIK